MHTGTIQKEQYWWIIGASIALTLIIYFLLHGQYIIHHVDDAWFGTRIYHYFHTGINADTVFAPVEVKDKGQIFYVLFYLIYGQVFELFGWTKSNSHLVCTIFVALSAPIWFFIFRKLKFSFQVSLIMGLSLLLFPVYFKAANHLRPEAMAFCIGSLSLLLFLSRYYWLSAFLIMVAFETHLMACTLGIYMLVHVGCNWKEYYAEPKTFFKNILLFALGILSGIAYYLYLHPEVLDFERAITLLMGYRTMGERELLKHVITTYFVQSRWYLHVWELILIIIGFRLYFKNKLHKKLPFIWILIVSLLVASLFLSRPNRNYMIYFFPAFQMLIFYAFEEAGRLKALAKALVVLFILQYGLRYYQYYGFDINAIMSNVEQELQDKSIPVVGIPDNWFPARDHQFYPVYGDFKDFPKEEINDFYLIRNDYKFEDPLNTKLEAVLSDAGIVKGKVIAKRKLFYDQYIEYFMEECDCNELRRFPAHKEHEVMIYLCKKR